MKVVFITPYPKGIAPSQRFRFEMYYDILGKKGITIKQYSFTSKKGYSRLYDKKYLVKVWIVLIGSIKRICHLFFALGADLIFLHREAAPIGPPWFEYLAARVFGKKIIYDFDDAIWMSDPNRVKDISSSIRSRSKVIKIIKWSWKVSVGNKFLAEYAKKHNPNTYIIPTIVDTENKHNPTRHSTNISEKLKIGWTGSHSTAIYIESIFEELNRLHNDYSFEFIFISNQPPKKNFSWIHYIKWSPETEINDLAKIDIGLMPLENTNWERGKCGFKLIQYMAMGIPAIGSDVGVNSEIISDNENGMLVDSNSSFVKKIKQLLSDSLLVNKLKINGRNTIVEKYSKIANQEDFLKLFSS